MPPSRRRKRHGRGIDARRTGEASVDASVTKVLAQAGQIDAPVDNAGFSLAGFVEDISLGDYRRQMETSFFGLVAVTKAVLPHMRERRTGRIIDLSSVGGPHRSSRHRDPAAHERRLDAGRRGKSDRQVLDAAHREIGEGLRLDRIARPAESIGGD